MRHLISLLGIFTCFDNKICVQDQRGRHSCPPILAWIEFEAGSWLHRWHIHAVPAKGYRTARCIPTQPLTKAVQFIVIHSGHYCLGQSLHPPICRKGASATLQRIMMKHHQQCTAKCGDKSFHHAGSGFGCLCSARGDWCRRVLSINAVTEVGP
ncbi:uncharacterized protein HMPREF1120_04025 [Exophiala dermatitidis NIH/UT8656]|uniref:Uncharacterized protein n=1 Tax=Exophiala dermatitidis (strain ATCC 34100 / CBS 525.76 / NIH/UT8656) TaxID=858893 RepID=H6BVP0_EXODN|nr:uncharacterized protein HMPREF1120_04025 [Exophiala dermatitidis NIH/UT8656]EHY55916.1 hypothetical protein HMPREF1120_04025 [Exophiala dermatitidis NIH/UT8656]